MSLPDNAFSSLPLARVLALQEAYVQCVEDIATAGQSYTLGRTFTRANLADVTTTLSKISDAVDYLQGKKRTVASAVVSRRNR